MDLFLGRWGVTSWHSKKKNNTIIDLLDKQPVMLLAYKEINENDEYLVSFTNNAFSIFSDLL